MANALINNPSDLQLFTMVPDESCQLCALQLMDFSLCEKCQENLLKPEEGPDNNDEFQPIRLCAQCVVNTKFNNEQCKGCGQSKSTENNSEATLVNSEASQLQTFVSLTVRDRRHKHETYAEYVFQNIMKKCQKSQKNFIDDEFPHSEQSIGSGSFSQVSQWLRISNVALTSHEDHKLPWTIFSSPKPSDIQQGALGNCWLIAVLALIAERPRLLEHILFTKKINSEGIYLVRICHNGLWKTVILDDFFPCTKHKQLVFTQAKRRQLYVPLIEKACAKIFGSYSSLRSGNMREGLQLLTGAPCDYIDLEPSDDRLDGDIVWTKLLSAFQSNLLMGVSSGRTDVNSAEYDRVHIHGNHAFSILAVHDLDIAPYRFVLVRDPHSRSFYSENSLTEDILKQLHKFNSTSRSTGAFWISWPRFLRYFSSVTISNYNSDHFDLREVGKFTQSASQPVQTFHFRVPQKSYICISLLYHRKYRKTPNFHTQSFVLCDAENMSANGVIGKRVNILRSQRGGYTYWTGSLEAGSYVLIPFSTSFWNDNKGNLDFTVVIHSAIQFELDVKKRPATFLADCLISAVTKGYSKKAQNVECNLYTTPSTIGLKIFVVENTSVNNFLMFTVNVTLAKNVRHSRHNRLPYDTNDCIPPQHRQIICITEWIDKHGESARLEYSYSHKFRHHRYDATPSIDISNNDLHSPRKL